jgi:hypothetical protein
MAGISGTDGKKFLSKEAARCCAIAGLILFASTACDHFSKKDNADASSGAELKYGTKVEFGTGGESERLRNSGWSKTEEKFSWSEGMFAVLVMRVAPTTESVTLRMKLSGLIKEPELPFQPVEVLVNDQKIADWQVGDTADFIAAIPHDLTKKGGELTITLKVPKATSPKALGLNADPRILGICCHELELTKG